MPQINLLPWREELRKEREKNFGLIMLVSVALAAGLVAAAWQFWNQQIAFQGERNAYLQSEIAVLDLQIEEIQRLEEQKERLIARMQIIEQLQASRPQIVHIFEELVNTLPDGVYLRKVTQRGANLEIEGTAQSSARVSAFMRNINDSEWLADPELTVIETRNRNAGSNRDSQFTLNAKAVSPNTPAEGEEGAS